MPNTSELPRNLDTYPGAKDGSGNGPLRRLQQISRRFGHDFGDALMIILKADGTYRADKHQRLLKQFMWHGQNSQNELDAARLVLQQEDVHAAASGLLTLNPDQK